MHGNYLQIFRMIDFQILLLHISSAQEQDTVAFRWDGKIFSSKATDSWSTKISQRNSYLPALLFHSTAYSLAPAEKPTSASSSLRCASLHPPRSPHLISKSTMLFQYLGGKARVWCSWFSCSSTQCLWWVRQGNFWACLTPRASQPPAVPKASPSVGEAASMGCGCKYKYGLWLPAVTIQLIHQSQLGWNKNWIR